MVMGRTVAELEQTLSANELREWAAFAAEEPIGEIRADYRSAIVANVIAQVNGNKGSKVTNFMPFLKQRDDESAEARDTAARFHAEFAKAIKGKTLRVIR